MARTDRAAASVLRRRLASVASRAARIVSGAPVATSQPTLSFSGRTAWARNLETPLREFLRTETGGAAVLLAATAAALVWVNVDAHSYDSVWSTRLSIELSRWGVA